MASTYVGIEDFVERCTGDEMAVRIAAAAASDPLTHAVQLEFDPESSGLGLGAPSDRLLRMVVEVAVRDGLLAPAATHSLELDDDDLIGIDFVAPVMAHAVTEVGLVGRFSETSFPRGSAPGTTATELAEHASRRLQIESWANDVVISVEDDFVLVEAPEIAVLDRACRAIGTPGLVEFADSSFWEIQEAAAPRSPPEAWEVRQRGGPRSGWTAAGPATDVVDLPVGKDHIQVTLGLYARLETADEARGSRIDVSHEADGRVVVLGDAQADVEWAVKNLLGR